MRGKSGTLIYSHHGVAAVDSQNQNGIQLRACLCHYDLGTAARAAADTGGQPQLNRLPVPEHTLHRKGQSTCGLWRVE